MNGVILAAGRGNRLKAMGGREKPKVLYEVGGKTCLEHIMTGMKEAGVNEFIIVIGYLGEMIKTKYGKGESLGVKIDYVYQDLAQYGTGRAVQLVEPLLGKEDFILSYGDIIIAPENYINIMDLYNQKNMMVMSINWIEDPSQGGAVYLDDNEMISKLVEKPQPGSSSTHWNNAGLYIFKPLIFDYIDKISKSKRGEYELTDAILLLLEEKYKIQSFKIKNYWQDIGTPDQIAKIDKILSRKNDWNF